MSCPFGSREGEEAVVGLPPPYLLQVGGLVLEVVTVVQEVKLGETDGEEVTLGLED